MIRARRVASGLLLATALALASASCGGSPGKGATGLMEGSTAETLDGQTSSVTPAETIPLNESLSDEEAIIAAVHGYWRVILDASDPPNPHYEGLDQYMTGDARDRAIAVLEERLRNTLEVVIPANSLYRHQTTVVSVGPDEALVSDCGIDDLVLFDPINQEIIDDDIATTLWTVSLVRKDFGWVVASVVPIEDWEGATQCDI